MAAGPGKMAAGPGKMAAGPGKMAAARGLRGGAVRTRRSREGGLRTQAGSAASLGHGAVQTRVPRDRSSPLGETCLVLTADRGLHRPGGERSSPRRMEPSAAIARSAFIPPDPAVGREQRYKGRPPSGRMPAVHGRPV
ncbi:uncharacterized protein LOC144579809 [Callithrix jacchus]